MKDNNTKRKILKDRSFPNSEQINKHQNFDLINKDYNMIKKLMMKKTILWTVAIVGVVAVTGLLFLNKNTDKQLESTLKNTSDSTKVEEFIQPPVTGAEMPFLAYRISTKNGGVINYPTGSTITIPANAFVNKNGKAVSDSVDVKYREFHNPLEIFLSGIPMNYDSAGVSRVLESAGMIEILAFDKEDKLSLSEQSQIEIKMASATNEERFNLYELDTLTKNWVYKGKDKVEKINETKVSEVKKTSKKVEVQNIEMVKPVMSDPQKYCFKIGYDKNDFPELAAYENVQFQVTDNSFKPAYFKINWSKISLYSSDEEGSYIVKLKKADTAISVQAKPVFDKADYSKALEKFEERHKTASKERDQKEFDKMAELNKVNSDLGNYNSKDVLRAANAMRASMNNMNSRNNFVPAAFRTFSVGVLGIHNADFPIMMPILAYSFLRDAIKRVGDDSKKISYNTIFLVEKGKNTVFRFAKGEPVKCNPGAQNLMWTMTDKNEVAFFRIADYSKLIAGSENKILPIQAQSQELAFAEIKEFSE